MKPTIPPETSKAAYPNPIQSVAIIKVLLSSNVARADRQVAAGHVNSTSGLSHGSKAQATVHNLMIE